MAIVSYADQLVNSFIDSKGNDVSAILRGRLYQLKDIVALNEEIDSYEKMKIELYHLENEGFKATPEEGTLQ